MQIHDNYLKPLTGFYVNSARVSAGKTLDKLMHEADILAVSEVLYKLHCDIIRRLAARDGLECKYPIPFNPISTPGSMSGLEADLNDHKSQILLSDEWRRTIDNLTTGSGDSKCMTSALAPLIDLEACRTYKKRFKVADGIFISPVAFYSLIYGQNTPVLNFLTGKAEETGLSARFRTTFIQRGEKDYGTNWNRDLSGIEGEITPESILDHKIRSTRTDSGVDDSIISKLTLLAQKIYVNIGIKSRFTFNDENVTNHPRLDVLSCYNSEDKEWEESAADHLQIRKKCVFFPTPSAKLLETVNYLRTNKEAANNLGYRPTDVEVFWRKHLVPTYQKLETLDPSFNQKV